jgi:Luciferase
MSETLRDQLCARLSRMDGISEATSRFGHENRVAWRAGGREIAHLHSSEVIDIRVPASLQRQWRGDSRLIPRPRRSDWIECRFRSAHDFDFVEMLVDVAAKSSRHVVSRRQK